jgi:choline dehydrogenase-like flavoprotein
MNPFYDRVEKMMEVKQAGWNEVPKAGAIFAMMLNNIGITCDRGRFAYVGCRQCGFCMTGCIFGAKRNLTLNYIPRAEALGAEFRIGCEALSIKPSKNGYTVKYRTREGKIEDAAGSITILAANAIETPAILLRSREFLKLPEQVGKNLSNNGSLAFFMLLPENKFPNVSLYKGRNIATMITYSWWEEHKISIFPGCLPPAVAAATELPATPITKRSWGLAYKHFFRDIYSSRLLICLVLGLVEGKMVVETDLRGNPIIKPAMMENGYVDKVAKVSNHIAKSNGAQVLYVATGGFELGEAHPLGSVRMGNDPEKSATNPCGEIWGCPGLFVSDGSSIPCGIGVNPSLTIAANAERISDWILKNW